MLSNNLDFDSSTSTDSGVLIPHVSTSAPLALRRMLCHLLFAWTDSIQSVLSDPFAINDNRLSDTGTGKYYRVRIILTFLDDISDIEVLCANSVWSFESVNSKCRYLLKTE